MHCRVCDAANFELAVDLGRQPWCNHFLRREEVGTEAYYPLRVVYCTACSTAQLDYTVPKETMFADHTYLSGTTRSLGEHFQRVAAEVNERFLRNVPGKAVLDIGSNDGTQLRHYQRLGCEVLGVESSKTAARIAIEQDIPTLNEFFNLSLVERLGQKFHVINAAGVFFHLEELHSVTDGIRAALNDEGVFVVQFLYMKNIMEIGAFDQIYHEHLLYYNLRTIERLLHRHGLALFDAYLSPIHGGSIISFAAHAGRRPQSDRLVQMLRAEDESGCNELAAYRTFAQKIERLKSENLAYLDRSKEQGRKVFGFGAPAKGNTLLNYFQVGIERMPYLIERNDLRRGLYSPGMHIPIMMEDEVVQQPDAYYVLAWNFKPEILARNQRLIEQGIEFYFPIEPITQ